MALDIDNLLELAVGSARGRKALPVETQFVRELNSSDLDLVHNPPALGVTTSPLARIRHAHHLLARLLAEGRAQAEVALITGYSPSRISILQHDPAFKELVSYYTTQKEAKYLDVHERLATLGMSVVDELQERLEEDPAGFRNKELLAFAEFALDRSVTPGARQQAGSGPVSITVAFRQTANETILPPTIEAKLERDA